MKKTLLLLIAAATMAMVSCKKNDEKIIGSWRTSSVTNSSGDELAYSWKWTFNPNGNFIEYFGTATNYGTYSIGKSYLILNYDAGSSFSYDINKFTLKHLKIIGASNETIELDKI